MMRTTVSVSVSVFAAPSSWRFLRARQFPAVSAKRWMGLVTRNWERKRFYRDVSVYDQPMEDESHGEFGVHLDHRKLRTPLRKLFLVPSKRLAYSVAQEWSAQGHFVQPSLMHMTALCNTVIDDPQKRSMEQIIDSLTAYLQSDTICFRATELDDLVAMQQKEWDPIIKWFNERYAANIESVDSLLPPDPPSFPSRLLGNLRSMDSWTLTAFEQAVYSCKSLLLTCALFEGQVSPEKASDLARLETRHQVSRWGSVEWQHSLEATDLTSRLAASLLLSQLTIQH